MGRRLTSEGHFTHPQQIFMALDGELDRLVLQPDLVTAAIAQLKRLSSEKIIMVSVGETLTANRSVMDTTVRAG